MNKNELSVMMDVYNLTLSDVNQGAGLSINKAHRLRNKPNNVEFLKAVSVYDYRKLKALEAEIQKACND